MTRLAIVAAVAALASCGSSERCAEDEPGFRFIVHVEAVEAWGPADLGVQYANGAIERFDSYVPCDWPEPLVICAPFGPDASDGPAQVTFGPYVEWLAQAHADVLVDLRDRVDVELTVVELPGGQTDAGL